MSIFHFCAQKYLTDMQIRRIFLTSLFQHDPNKLDQEDFIYESHFYGIVLFCIFFQLWLF